VSGYDAIVLAGGTATRLGGVDKPSIDIAGKTMLERVLDACSGARFTVVVGTRRPTGRPVTWTLEEPPHGGPLAGLAAGLAALPADAERVVVLAADMPFMTDEAIAGLLSESAGHDAAVFIDEDGKAQPLAGVYRVSALNAALRACGELRDRSVKRILDSLRAVTVPDAGATRDCDTVDQIENARRTLRRT
jgi:molybdopterin-guanine dinucleotide biosynthesis protein A